MKAQRTFKHSWSPLISGSNISGKGSGSAGGGIAIASFSAFISLATRMSFEALDALREGRGLAGGFGGIMAEG